MKQPILDDYSVSTRRGSQKMSMMILGFCVILTAFLWLIAFVPSEYIILGEIKLGYRGVLLFILAITTGYSFTRYILQLKPEIRTVELLVRLGFVWLISELAYHGVEKLILHHMPISEFVRILFISMGAMIIVSGWVALKTFEKVKPIKDSK